MGYEILHFTANYFQLGQPSGVFQFDNMTAGLQPNGQPVPNTGNTFAGFELGSVRQANFTTYTTPGCRGIPSTACTSRTTGNSPER